MVYILWMLGRPVLSDQRSLHQLNLFGRATHQASSLIRALQHRIQNPRPVHGVDSRTPGALYNQREGEQLVQTSQLGLALARNRRDVDPVSFDQRMHHVWDQPARVSQGIPLGDVPIDEGQVLGVLPRGAEVGRGKVARLERWAGEFDLWAEDLVVVVVRGRGVETDLEAGRHVGVWDPERDDGGGPRPVDAQHGSDLFGGGRLADGGVSVPDAQDGAHGPVGRYDGRSVQGIKRHCVAFFLPS